MKNKKIIGLGILAASGILALAGCSEAHTHASEEWKHDSENHWKVCSADETIFDMEAHSFSKSEVAATDEADGYTLWTCSCGYTYKDAYTQKTYGITFEGNDLAYAIGLPTEAKLGAKVEFKVTVESGYEAYAVTASYGEGENATVVELDGSLAEGYEFTMPAAAVTIKAEARGAYFLVSAKDLSKVVIEPEAENASNRTVSDFLGGFVVDGKVQTGKQIYVRAGAKVNILYDYVAKAENVAFYVNDEELEYEACTVVTKEGKEAEGDTPAVAEETATYATYAFIMPNQNAAIDVTATEKAFDLTVEAPDYVTTLLYTMDEDGEKTEVTKMKGGMGKVYLDVALDADHSGGDFKIDGVTASYITFSGYTIAKNGEAVEGTPQTSTTTSSNEGKTYSYDVSSYTAYKQEIKLVVKVLEATYKNAAFLGNWGGTEIYGATVYSWGAKTVTINHFGEFDNIWSYSSNAKPLQVVNHDAENKTFELQTTSPGYYYHARYDENLLVVTYTTSTTDNFATAGDYYMLIKDKKYSDITWTHSGSFYYSVAYFEAQDSEGNRLGNFLSAGGDVYLNVDVQLDEGYTEISKSSNFGVYKNGTLLKHYDFVS